jgi:hypothetical protein
MVVPDTSCIYFVWNMAVLVGNCWVSQGVYVPTRRWPISLTEVCDRVQVPLGGAVGHPDRYMSFEHPQLFEQS